MSRDGARPGFARRLLRSVRPQAKQGPRVGHVRFGDLRRTEPISRWFGYDRGLPIDRYYIERFLQVRAADVRGRVLEIGDSTYTRRYGGEAVTRSDVLHVDEGNPAATFVADLANAPHLPGDTFDCIILTQTLHLLYDLDAVVATLHRILKPGGTLLLTAPGITQKSGDRWVETWFWSFTSLSLRRLFETRFPPAAIEVEAWGNVLASIAFLHGLAAEELEPGELERRDPNYELVIALRAQKPGAVG